MRWLLGTIIGLLVLLVLAHAIVDAIWPADRHPLVIAANAFAAPPPLVRLAPRPPRPPRLKSKLEPRDPFHFDQRTYT